VPVLKRFLAAGGGKADFIVRVGWNALQLSTLKKYYATAISKVMCMLVILAIACIVFLACASSFDKLCDAVSVGICKMFQKTAPKQDD
jgi:hypothetical protein